MSNVVDQRVVQMQFDNKQFESGVSTTMSTLDKLKQKLHLDGATKGLENIQAASKKVDFSQMEYSATRAGFQIQDVWLKTATVLEYQVAGKIIDIGKKMASALTIEPITTGFNEYETQINAVQTILANTESKGSTIDDVNRALEELNKYADMTIYNFTEMTRNIGTFTAAGVDLDTSTNAIKGIANLAAVSGSTSQQASTAMYQLSQALASGTVKLMDWNSVVNAGMGGQVFQDALKETARVHGVAIDSMIEEEGSFRETLSKGWLTSEILTDTLEKFTMYAEEGTEEWNNYMDALKQKGYTEEQAKEILKLGKTATEAATKVKTFTQLWDVLKEAAQSGWSQSWKIIIGDFEEAKELLSPLADVLTGFLNKMSDARNFILKNVLDFGEMWSSIMDKLDAAGLTKIKEVVKSVGDMTDKLEYYQDVVTRVWRGDFNNQGDNPDRRDLLKEAGYDPRVVQDLVNKGYEYKLTVEDIEESHKKFGLTMEESKESTEEVAESINSLTDEQLKNAGLTEQEIRLYRDLEEQSKRTGKSIDEIAEEMSEVTGRMHLIEAFKNVGNALIGIFTAMKEAWSEIIPPISIVRLYYALKAIREFSEGLKLVTQETDEFGNTYYKLNENGEKFKRIFQGVFAALKLVATIVGGPIKLGFKILAKLLGAFNLPILDILANVGDAIVKFEQWFDSLLEFNGAFDAIAEGIKEGVIAIRDWVKENIKFKQLFDTIGGVIGYASRNIRDWITSLKDAEDLPTAIAEGIVNGFKKIPTYLRILGESIKKVFSGVFDGDSFELDPDSFLGKFVEGLKVAGQVVGKLGEMLLEKINGVLTKHGFQEISLDAIQGLVLGFKENAGKVWDAVVELAQKLINKVKEVLGIHSPSTVFFAIGGFIIAGLVGGLLAGSDNLKGAMQTLGTKLGEFFAEIDFKSIFSAVLSAGLLKAVMDVASGIKNLGGIGDGIADMFDGIGDILENASKVVKSFSKYLKAAAFEKSMNGLKSMAIALAIIVGSVVVLTLVDQTKLKTALISMGIIAGIMVAMFALMQLINKISGGNIASTVASAASLSGVLVGLGLSMILIAAALKILSGVDLENSQALEGLVACVLSILAVMTVCAVIAQGEASKNVKQVGGVLIKLAVALLLMTLVIKALGSMDEATLKQGLTCLAIVVGMIALIMLITKIPSKEGATGLAGTLLAMAVAIGVMAIVVASLGGLERETLIKGMAALGTLIVAMALIMAMTWLATDKDMMYLAGVLLSMSVALGVMALVVTHLGGLEKETLIKGMAALGTLIAAIALLVLSTKLTTTSEMIGLAGTLIAMAIAIGVMAVVVTLLGLLSEDHLKRGITAVSALGLIMAIMIAATYGAQNCKGNIIAMTVAIALMAVAVVALSFIPWENLAPAVIGMAVLMGMFALMIKAAGTAQSSIPVLIIMTVAMTLMGVLLYMLAKLPVENVLASAVSLSLVLITITGVLFLLSKINDMGGALLGVILLTTMALPLFLFSKILASMDGLQNAISNAIALGVLVLAMTVALIPLSVIGSFVLEAVLGVVALTTMALPLYLFVQILASMEGLQNAQANTMALITLVGALTLLLIPLTVIGAFVLAAVLGVVALTTMALPLYLFVQILATMEGLQNAEANTNLLIRLMTVMTALVVILAPLAPLILLGVAAISALMVLITAFGALAMGVGALMEKFPELESFIDKGIPILEKLAYALGSLIGNFIGGFVETVAVSLPKLGLALSAFMVGAMPFVSGIKMVDASMLEGIGVLTSAILLLTAADLVNGIVTFLGGGSSFADLGTELSNFITNAQPFIEGMKGVDPASFTAVSSLADAIVKLTAANVLDGLTSWFAGESSLAAFGEDLAAFGPSMKTYADAVAGIDTEAVKTSADAASTLAGMASELPNEGGLLGKIFGENSMDSFAAQLEALGTGMKAYSDSVIGIDTAAIDASVTAAKSLTEVADAIPNDGGWLGKIVGENDMETFGSDLESFGSSLKAYADSVVGLDTEAVTNSVTAGKDLAGMADVIPATGGMWAVFSGDNDIATFGTNLESFGSSLVAYATAVAGLDTEAVTNSVTAARSLADVAAAVPESGIFVPDDLANFADDIEPFGSAIKAYSDSVAGVSTTNVENSVTAAKKVVGLVKDLSGLDSGDAKEFKKALGHLGESSVDDFVNAFDDSVSDLENIGGKMMKAVASGAEDKASKVADAAKEAAEDAAKKAESKDDKFKSAGKKMVEAFADGLTKTSKAESAAKDLAKAAADKADDKKSSFTSAGKDMVSGFASGITINTFKAEAAAKAMAQAALDAAKEKLKINSPSKVFMAMAASIPEGVAMGIDKLQGMVIGSASNMADSAINTVKRSISNLGNLVNTDIETQPTIRPVLDLSDVKSNASKIDNLLGFNHSVGIMANVGSISSLMNNSRGGTNDDVVDAINNLNKGLGELDRNTYNVNGITYDDSSAMGEAVSAVIRAARIGGRV